MIRLQFPHDDHPREIRIPRWAAPLIWATSYCVIHFVVPWILSIPGPRFGWAQRRPGVPNMLGLLLVAAGALCIAWALARHFARLPSRQGTAKTDTYLVTDGPYAFSRNPLYISALAIWLGWAFFYGSPTVLAGLIALWAGLALLAVPSEERSLEAHFGEAYLRYKASVPRWIALRPRRRGPDDEARTP